MTDLSQLWSPKERDLVSLRSSPQLRAETSFHLQALSSTFDVSRGDSSSCRWPSDLPLIGGKAVWLTWDRAHLALLAICV